MKDHFRLIKSAIERSGPKNLIILVNGNIKYYDIFRHALVPKYKTSRWFPDNNGLFEWGFYIYDIDDKGAKEVKKLLELLEKSVCIDDALFQTFALDYHFEFSGGRTAVGADIHAAKPYKKPMTADRYAAADALVTRFTGFIKCHPSYIRSDYFLAVPPSPNKKFDLPSYIASKICSQLQVASGQAYVKRIKNIPVKDAKSLKEKTEAIAGAFEFTAETPFSGKLVTIIDDIYQTGATLHELGTLLESAGATVQALVATKTLSDLW
jgi:hypothetical protein